VDSPDIERDALLQLWCARGWGPTLIRRALEQLGSPSRVLGASAARLAEAVEGIGARRAETLLRAAAQADRDAQVEQLLAAAAQAGARVTTLLDEQAYPPLLAPLADAPPVLFVRGSPEALAQWRCVAVVGSRRMSQYGREQAHRFATGFAQAGLFVVSGGARGVDAAAHEAALAAGGATVVVQGAGLAHTYPPEHAQLFARVVEQGGCVVSELAPDVAPSRETFPRRNRIIAGMCLGTLVVEAPRTSGALITARFALEQGRDVFALPGRLDAPGAEGCNRLIADGEAALALSPGAVLEALEAVAWHAHRGRAPEPLVQGGAAGNEDDAEREAASAVAHGPRASLRAAALTDRQRRLIDALAEPCTLDEALRLSGLAAGEARAELTLLEVRGLVVREGERLRAAARAQ